jgi:geranyl-CoA carboxylase alpha subunit
MQIDGVGHAVAYAVGSGASETVYFRADGRNHLVRDLSFQAVKPKSAGGGDGFVRAPMNGRVAMVAIRAGDNVKAGQPLIVLEAMKMEHALTAPRDGAIAALHVAEGEQVAPGKLLIELADA